MVEGGTVSAGGAGGMAGDTSSGPSCPEGYQPWLRSGFSFPDGDVIGTADFPSMPWVTSGSLSIDGGRLTGAGTATLNQGTVFPYADSRTRFRARFTDSDQQVTVAFDAAKNGAAGVRLTLDSAGSLVLTEGTAEVDHRDVAPLETGVDWYVEAVFEGGNAKVSLAKGNYGSAPGATVEGVLATEPLAMSASGSRFVVELGSSGGISPALEEVSFARCGVAPPEYEALFVDTFERANSGALGKAELPASSAWVDDAANTSIVGGGLEVLNLGVAIAPLATVPSTGLRIRTTVSTVSGNDFLWANVNYNGDADPETSVIAEPGFWLWGDHGKAPYTTVFRGQRPEKEHPDVLLVDAMDYFMELARDGADAVLTVRMSSFDGPIVAADYQTGLSEADNTGQQVKLSSSGSGALFKDFRIERYGE